jgi:indolepyruvate ferredoxin oxidoreductase
MFMLGAAWQMGLVPLTLASIDRAIELNGVAIESNRRAFLWGRRAAHDPAAIERIAAGSAPTAQVIRFDPKKPATLAEILADRIERLTQYQDAAYARRYAAAVERTKQAEAKLGAGDALAKAVAKYLYKLMAHKDEWEVARLYARPEFRQELERAFEGDLRLRFHVAGGPFGKRDAASGKLVKREVGPWLMTAFRLMAPLRRLRGSLLDPFRNAGERRLARELLATYEADLDRIVAELDAGNHALAVRLASLPEKVRGYGHVREQHAQAMKTEREALLAQWPQGGEAVVEVKRRMQAA